MRLLKDCSGSQFEEESRFASLLLGFLFTSSAWILVHGMRKGGGFMVQCAAVCSPHMQKCVQPTAELGILFTQTLLRWCPSLSLVCWAKESLCKSQAQFVSRNAEAAPQGELSPLHDPHSALSPCPLKLSWVLNCFLRRGVERSRDFPPSSLSKPDHKKSLRHHTVQ